MTSKSARNKNSAEVNATLQKYRNKYVGELQKKSLKHFRYSDKLLEQFGEKLFSLTTFYLLYVGSLFFFLEKSLNIKAFMLPVHIWISLGLATGTISLLLGLLVIIIESRYYSNQGVIYSKEAFKVITEKKSITHRMIGIGGESEKLLYKVLYLRYAQVFFFTFSILIIITTLIYTFSFS